MTFNDLFEELLAISLIDVEECKKNKEKLEYLEGLLLDFYNKLGRDINDLKGQDESFWSIMEIERLRFEVVRDTSLSTEQKMIIYNNFSQCKIKSLSQFRRLMIQRGNE